MKAGSGRLAVSVMGCLHRYLNGFGGGREKWTQYRWFFCTTEIRDIPQGKWGSFVILAGKLKPGILFCGNISNQKRITKLARLALYKGYEPQQNTIKSSHKPNGKTSGFRSQSMD